MQTPPRKIVLTLCASWSFFVASLYMGVMWALHFFWYPGWHSLTLDNVGAHFVGPTDRATEFFTILVPIMGLTALLLLIMEWRTPRRWPCILIFLGITAATLVGKFLIIPINKEVAAGLASQDSLNGMLEKWMVLNNWRMGITTIMWLGCLFYFIIPDTRSITPVNRVK
jgi:hypothetical protein